MATRSMSRGRRIGTGVAFFGAGCILAAATVLAPSWDNESDQSRNVQAAPSPAGDGVDGVPLAPLSETEPCADSESVTSTELVEESTVPVVLPDASEGGTDVASTAFCGGSVDAPVITFEATSAVSARASTAKGSIDGSSPMWAFYEEQYPEQGRNEWLAALAEQWGGRGGSDQRGSCLRQPRRRGWCSQPGHHDRAGGGSDCAAAGARRRSGRAAADPCQVVPGRKQRQLEVNASLEPCGCGWDSSLWAGPTHSPLL